MRYRLTNLIVVILMVLAQKEYMITSMILFIRTLFLWMFNVGRVRGALLRAARAPPI